MELVYFLIILMMVLILYSIIMQRKSIRDTHKKIMNSESSTQMIAQGILGKIGHDKEIVPTQIYPVAGSSLRGISFYEFIEARDIEKLKQLELANADIIVTDVLEKLGYQGIIGH